jgi:ferredoxin-like protein FixX
MRSLSNRAGQIHDAASLCMDCDACAILARGSGIIAIHAVPATIIASN